MRAEASKLYVKIGDVIGQSIIDEMQWGKSNKWEYRATCECGNEHVIKNSTAFTKKKEQEAGKHVILSCGCQGDKKRRFANRKSTKKIIKTIETGNIFCFFYEPSDDYMQDIKKRFEFNEKIKKFMTKFNFKLKDCIINEQEIDKQTRLIKVEVKDAENQN